MAELTYDKLLTAIIVIVLIAGAYNTIMQTIKNRREEKKLRDSPITELQSKVSRHDELFQNDKDRLDAMEQRITEMGQESTIMLRGVRALLAHLVNNNSFDKLKDSMTEIDDYLISRK